MIYIRIADITVKIDNKYDYVERLCRGYIVAETATPDMTVFVTDEEIDEEMRIAEGDPTRGYAEGVCIYRNICKQLPQLFGAYLMHCAVIE